MELIFSRWLPLFRCCALIAWSVMAFASGCSRSVETSDQDETRDPEMRRAASFLEAGKTDEAIRAYEQVLDQRSGMARAHLDLAILQHDEKKDHISAIYHYRKYLALRPETQKKQMIEDRIRLAQQSLLATLASVRGTPARDDAAALKKENQQLKEELLFLRRGNAAPKRQALSTPRADGSPATRAGLRKHLVVTGENLSLIATAYNVQISDLVKINGLKDANSIQVGQVLAIPDVPGVGDVP